MRFVHLLTSHLLILTLGLSTYGIGVARAQAPVVDEMVICTGHGIVVIGVDASGNPVERRTLCPDNVTSLLSVTAFAPPVVTPVALRQAWTNWPVAQARPVLPHPITRGARAPPA